MATEQAIRDGSQVTSLLVVNSSAITETLNVYGDSAKHSMYVSTFSVADSSPSLSNVSVSASNFTVLSTNAARQGAIIVNNGSATVYVKLGATATTSSYSYRLSANAQMSIPEPGQPIYTGQIDAIGDAATGTLRVTEF